MSLKVRAEVRFLSNISVGGETKETVFTLGEMLELSRELFFSRGTGKSLSSI